MDLPRIPKTPLNANRLTPDQRLHDASAFLKNLLTDMPKRVAQGELFKISLIPPRLAAVREVQRYRMAELSVEAYRCLQTQRGITAAVLIRASFETAAVLFYVDNIARKALADDALGDAGGLLLRVIVGSKITKNETEATVRKVPTIEAVNVMSMIRQLDKTYAGFAREYDYLCEIAHPNQMGALVPFGEIASGLDVDLSTKPTFGDQFFATFCMALAVFEHHYNRIADVFPAFIELCRRDAPRE